MGKGLILCAGLVVGNNLLIATSRQGSSEDIEALLLVQLPIHRRMISTRNTLEDIVDSLLDVSRLPARREVIVEIDWVGLPPERSVDSSSSSENASSHLVDVGASNAGGINPDLVAETGDIETGEVSALEPFRLHGSTPATGRWRALLDQKDALARLRQLVGDGDTTSASTDDNVVVRASGCRCSGASSWAGRCSGRRWSRRRGTSILLHPVGISCFPSTRDRYAELRLAVVVEVVGVSRVGKMLGPSNDLEFFWQLAINCAILVPNPAPLAAVDQTEMGLVDLLRDRRQSRISSVWVRSGVSSVNCQQCKYTNSLSSPTLRIRTHA